MSSTSANAQGNTPLTTTNNSKGGDGDHKSDDADLRSQIALLTRQMAVLLADRLPLTAGIASVTGQPVKTPQPSYITGLRTSAANMPAKHGVGGGGASLSNVSPSTPLVPSGIIHHPTHLHSSFVNNLTDIGLDGKQDEPTATTRVATLAAPLATSQCHYVDAEHDGSFMRWFKDTKWKASYGREAKMLARFADLCRMEVNDVTNSELMELICCRIAAVDTLNRGLGSAAADAIEGRHRLSIVPHHVRISAVKEGNMMARLAAKSTMPSKQHTNTHSASHQSGEGKDKKKDDKATGGAANDAATTGGEE